MTQNEAIQTAIELRTMLMDTERMIADLQQDYTERMANLTEMKRRLERLTKPIEPYEGVLDLQ